MGLSLNKIYKDVNEPFVTFKDRRDFCPPPAQDLLFVVDLSQFDSPVTSQTIGSCTADAVASLYENLLNQKGKKYRAHLSRMFLYHGARQYLKRESLNTGSSIRLAVKSLLHIGVCPDSAMPYEEAESLFTPPNADMIEQAQPYKIQTYYSVVSVNEMINSLSEGRPAVFAILLEGSGQAMLCVGYDRTNQTFKCKNSRGPKWGTKGYCFITFEQMAGLIEGFTFDIKEDLPVTESPGVVAQTKKQCREFFLRLRKSFD
jgi:hypothetical protein